MRGMDHKESAQTLLDGLRIYHNYIRKHQALGGKTPAQASGISIDLGQNKIHGIISIASSSDPQKASSIKDRRMGNQRDASNLE
jgi:hypothetical protein